jgi:uncharacterized protein (UPF0332 family)
MTSADLISQARLEYEVSRDLAKLRLNKVAARLAYIAALHAATAFILEHTGTVDDAHQSMLAVLTRLLADSQDDKMIEQFLARAVKYKDVASGDAGAISDLEVTVTLYEARQVIERIANLLGASSTRLDLSSPV